MPAARNVLLIVVDQWRGDSLAVLGHPCVRTPHIDALCRDGVTFRNHYTQASPCGPARTSLLTGTYMMTHRVVQNGTPLAGHLTNLAFELRRGGYDPALIGYTTTTPDPTTVPAGDPRYATNGELMEGWRPVATFEPDKQQYFAWLAQRGFPLPERGDDVWLAEDAAGVPPGPTTAPSRVDAAHSDTAWVTECALRFLDAPVQRERPWFLHLGYYRPHPPFIAPAPYNARVDPADTPPPLRAATRAAAAAQHPLLAHYHATLEAADFFERAPGLAADLTAREVAVMRATYYGLMQEVDDGIGRVVERLKALGQWEDTLVILTCDHGEMLGDHYMLGKSGFYDQSFHIPMVLRDPRAEAAPGRGRIVEVFTETVDTMPTILDWLGLPIPRQCDGRSLLPFARGQDPADWRDAVHFEFDFRDSFKAEPRWILGVPPDRSGLCAIRDRHYKYVHFDALPPLFFDLRDDPGQLRNRADDPAFAPLVLEYAQKMLSWRLRHADRRLTHWSASPVGLIERS